MPIFLVLAGATLQVEVLRIDRLFVDDLRQLGAHVLQPIARARMLPMMAQRLDVEDAGDKARAVYGTLPADDGAAVIHNHRLSSTGVDWRLAVGVEEVRREARCEYIEIILQGAGSVGDLEGLALRERRGQGGPIHHFGAVHGEAAAV